MISSSSRLVQLARGNMGWFEFLLLMPSDWWLNWQPIVFLFINLMYHIQSDVKSNPSIIWPSQVPACDFFNRRFSRLCIFICLFLGFLTMLWEILFSEKLSCLNPICWPEGKRVIRVFAAKHFGKYALTNKLIQVA